MARENMSKLLNSRISVFQRARALANLMSDRLSALPLLVLYLTDGCNSRCVMCDIWKNPRRNMEMSLVDHLATEVAKLGTRWVLLSGGEAMQHPEWPQIAARFRSQGVRVLLLTNGLLVKRQSEAVIENVDELIVSMDAGTAETYQRIRGVDAFDLIWEGIALSVQAGIPVTTRTTVQQANFREIEAIIERGLHAGVQSISFLPIDIVNPFAFGERFPAQPAFVASMGIGAPSDHGPVANALTSEEARELEQILERLTMTFADAFADRRIAESPEKLRRILLLYFQALLGQAKYPPPPCNAPHFSTVVEVDGRLRPCYFLPDYGRLISNEQSFSEALNVPGALELRSAYRKGQRDECGRCVCPLFKGARQLIGM